MPRRCAVPVTKGILFRQSTLASPCDLPKACWGKPPTNTHKQMPTALLASSNLNPQLHKNAKEKRTTCFSGWLSLFILSFNLPIHLATGRPGCKGCVFSFHPVCAQTKVPSKGIRLSFKALTRCCRKMFETIYLFESRLPIVEVANEKRFSRFWEPLCECPLVLQLMPHRD